MPLTDTILLVLRRGLGAAVASAGVFALAALGVGAAFAARENDRHAGLIAAFVALLIVSPLMVLSAFAAFALGLERTPRVREVLRCVEHRWPQAGSSLLVALFPAFILPVTAVWCLEAASGHVDGVNAFRVGVALALVSLAALCVWTYLVVLPLAAVFVDGTPASEARRRSFQRFMGETVPVLIATNAPSLILASAIPTGPLQDRLAQVFLPQTLIVVRACVGAAALVVAVVLHAAVAVAAYRASDDERGEPAP